MIETVVKSNTQLNKSAYIIELDKMLQFKAGQVISLWIDDIQQARLYSIASGENDKTTKILYEVVSNGVLTNRMKTLKTGDTVYLSQPMGYFLNTVGRAMWIATGTGIAPFISMMLSGYTDNKTLLHGSRTIDGFYFQNKIKEVMKDRYLRFCTAEESPDVISGRITTFLQQKDDLEPNIIYYLCGNNQMVIDIRQILIGKGVPYENIKAEIYF